MQIRKIFFVFLSLLLTLAALAQKKEFTREQALQRKNNVALNLGGNGLFLSASYDRILLVRAHVFMDASVGIGVVPMVGSAVFSQQLMFSFGKKTGFFEFGIGGTYEWHKTDASGFTETETSFYLSPILGWKKIFRNHLLLRLYGNPMFPLRSNNCCMVFPYAGVSLGYTF